MSNAILRTFVVALILCWLSIGVAIVLRVLEENDNLADILFYGGVSIGVYLLISFVVYAAITDGRAMQ